MSKLEFTREQFETRIRQTLAAHLSDVIPEREREKIFNLVHDVAHTAADVANARLKEMLLACPVVECGEGLEPGDPPIVHYGYSSDPGTHRGRLVNVEALDGAD